MATITVTLVTEDGAIDQEASRQEFNTQLANYVSAHETQRSVIADTVNGLLDTHKGVALTMPMIASMACARLNAQPANFSTLEELVLGYVRENASERREDGKLFRISKGKGGGIRLWRDIVDAK